MFRSLFRHLKSTKSQRATPAHRKERPRKPVQLKVEHLESRLVPTSVNLAAAISGTTLMLSETSAVGINGISVTEAAKFGALTISVPAGDTITFGGVNKGTTFTTAEAITALSIKLGAGADTLTIGDPTFQTTLSLPGNLAISGTGGNKTLNLDSVSLLHAAALSVTLAGNGTETSTFTNVNVGGSAMISHPGTSNTTVSILSSTNASYNWGSLTITNGQGDDTNIIGDTNFLGNMTINNGDGGSLTNLSAINDQNLANIYGNLSISTMSGQSANELYDYNVRGNVAISTGSGASGKTNFVGLENLQTAATSGVPIINGSVSVRGIAPGNGALIVDAGTDVGDPAPGGGTAGDLPLTVLGNLSITANGSGAADITLNDLNVPSGSTALTLGSATTNDKVLVQAGASFTSVYNNFTLTSNGAGANIIGLQDQAGTLVFGGAVSIQINVSTTSTVEVGADASHITGVANARVEFTGATTFKAAKTKNKFFGEQPSKVFNNNILSFTSPSVSSNFTLS